MNMADNYLGQSAAGQSQYSALNNHDDPTVQRIAEAVVKLLLLPGSPLHQSLNE